jgi:REP element-mobilizing transposase RayT
MGELKSQHGEVVFNSLDRDAEIQITERYLPHWFQTGAAVFVTFRTADSIPSEVIARWRKELVDWLRIQKLPETLADFVLVRRSEVFYKVFEQLNPVAQREFTQLSDRLFHRSLDECHGACWLRHPELAKIVGDAIKFFDGNKYDLDRFVVMPNHVHAIVQFRPDADLKTVSESWMRFTARQINLLLKQKGAFWQPEPFDHIIRSSEQFYYLEEYISNNPRKANLKEGEYLYWERPKAPLS